MSYFKIDLLQDPQNLKIPVIGSKIKVVESGWYDLSQLVREGHSPIGKMISSIWSFILYDFPDLEVILLFDYVAWTRLLVAYNKYWKTVNILICCLVLKVQLSYKQPTKFNGLLIIILQWKPIFCAVHHCPLSQWEYWKTLTSSNIWPSLKLMCWHVTF